MTTGPTPAGRDTPIPDVDPAAPVPSPVGNVDATASIGDAAATVPTADRRPDPGDDSTATCCAGSRTTSSRSCRARWPVHVRR